MSERNQHAWLLLADESSGVKYGDVAELDAIEDKMMPFYKVTKIMKYTVDVYVEANNAKEACDKSGHEEGTINHDDEWYDSYAVEISKDEYLDETE